MLDSATVVQSTPPTTTPPSKGTCFGHRYSVVFLSLWGQPHYPVLTTTMPAHPHTLVEAVRQTSGPSIPSRPSKFSRPVFFPLWAFPYYLQLFQDVFFFVSALFLRGPSRNVGRRWAQGGVDHGPGPGLLLFCLAEQTAAGKKRRERRNEGTDQGTQAGWPRRRRDTGSLFFPPPFFFFVLSEWGPPLLSWGGPLYFESVQDPPSPPSHRQSFTNSHPCITRLDKPGGWQRFEDALESCRRPARKRGLLSCRCQAEALFLLPLRRSL